MVDSLVEQVWRRAGSFCEYCRFFQDDYPIPFVIDHVIARQHGGQHVLTNLALSCLHCNAHKGPNIAGLDPRSGKLTRLFNPRRQRWNHHFRWCGQLVVGITPVGRTTVAVLAMNDPEPVRLRQALIEEGVFPTR